MGDELFFAERLEFLSLPLAASLKSLYGSGMSKGVPG